MILAPIIFALFTVAPLVAAQGIGAGNLIKDPDFASVGEKDCPTKNSIDICPVRDLGTWSLSSPRGYAVLYSFKRERVNQYYFERESLNQYTYAVGLRGGNETLEQHVSGLEVGKAYELTVTRGRPSCIIDGDRSVVFTISGQNLKKPKSFSETDETNWIQTDKLFFIAKNSSGRVSIETKIQENHCSIKIFSVALELSRFQPLLRKKFFKNLK